MGRGKKEPSSIATPDSFSRLCILFFLLFGFLPVLLVLVYFFPSSLPSSSSLSSLSSFFPLSSLLLCLNSISIRGFRPITPPLVSVPYNFWFKPIHVQPKETRVSPLHPEAREEDMVIASQQCPLCPWGYRSRGHIRLLSLPGKCQQDVMSSIVMQSRDYVRICGFEVKAELRSRVGTGMKRRRGVIRRRCRNKSGHYGDTTAHFVRDLGRDRLAITLSL